MLIRVDGVGKADLVNGSFAGHPLRFFPVGSGVAALVGVDLAEKPGPHPFYVEAPGVEAPGVETPGVETPDTSGQPRRVRGEIEITAARFAVERLTLPREKVEISPETLKRVQREAARLKAVLAVVTPEQLWQGAFILPVDSGVQPTGFGLRRIINGEPRSPHTGADIKAPLGTAVLAASTGRVVLVDEQFFAGRLVVLDHGFGIHTMYFHLQKQHVRQGEEVTKGQLLGTVGATGRVTGPHLHFGVRVQDARVDPLSLLRLPLGP
jgi:murein DD-endopeptidase MepM/ murein hydrolase activator NlpD